ncbi:hypothetical protein MPER_00117 [Moniliophthora perniciosa FA553]|nr:hypothetical protein MPER_00117 [Moniliophthora perniciosa FA553]
MGVGSVGDTLLPYEDRLIAARSATHTSQQMPVFHGVTSDSGHTKYEFGDSGSILVAVNDEETTDEVAYSLDLGRTW